MGKIKDFVRLFLSIAKKKTYKVKLNEDLVELQYLHIRSDNEFFYGYYDRSPENQGKILFHEMLSDEKSVRIIVK